jgi:sugar O-acyltransferase (sialic acid O-acetyltransferase NeuD family)
MGLINQQEGTRLKTVVIVGAGGFGREVLEIFNDCNKVYEEWDVLGFVDDDVDLHDKVFNGYPVLGNIEWLGQAKRTNVGCVCAVGNCASRKRIVEKLHRMGINFYRVIHPSVIISESVEMGHDVIICAGSILTVDIKIGDHVHIDTNCTVAHDAVLENYCRLGPGVRMSGETHLREGVYVGTGATLIQQVSVGKWTTIGAGAAVINNIPANVVVVGVPARTVD